MGQVQWATEIDIESNVRPAPEFFATTAEVERLEAELAESKAEQRPQALVHVAWQLRQRDCQRAKLLAQEAKTLLQLAKPAEVHQQRLLARLALVHAETHWLANEIETAKALAQEAMASFSILNDAIGAADAHWLMCWIAFEQGDTAARHQALENMVACAEGVDPVRVIIAKARQATNAVLHDVVSGVACWQSQLTHDPANLHPAAAAAVADFWGAAAQYAGNYAESVLHRNNAFNQALETGQIRRAIVAASNICEAFTNLNDNDSALEWAQRDMDMARNSGWPGLVGGALMTLAPVLANLQRLDAAADLLREAQVLMAPSSASRNYAESLRHLGNVEIARGYFKSALEAFRLLEQRAVALSQADMHVDALRGQAKALLELGQPGPAAQAAQMALAAAGSDPYTKISVLRVLADIHARHSLAAPMETNAPNAALHYLHLALAAAANVKDYVVPSDLLEDLAREYAQAGDLGRAYELSVQANQVRQRTHSQENNKRASALQVNHEAEKIRAEGEHQRQLALANAARADALERANATLEELGAVGRDIASNLDAMAIFTALDRHVHALLDATSLCIYRQEHDGLTLKMVFWR